jgi:hypothetical protein
MNITKAKQAVKIWILDHSESWAPSTQNNKSRLQLHCISEASVESPPSEFPSLVESPPSESPSLVESPPAESPSESPPTEFSD